MVLLALKEDDAPIHIVSGVAVAVTIGIGLTVILMVVVVSHCPAVGVNV
jgi:hypothetical protein